MLFNTILGESIFIMGFLGLNGINYLINYLIYFKESNLLPYITRWAEKRQLGLASSSNQDFFRYNVEFSLFVLLSRFVDSANWYWVFSLIFFVHLIFNLYQYGFRHIYKTEPNFYGDYKLLKNGLVIVWSESKWKVLLGVLGFLVASLFVMLTTHLYLEYIGNLGLNVFFVSFAVVWSLSLLWSIHKVGISSTYPNDIFRRYHFFFKEVLINVRKSLSIRQLVRMKIGEAYSNLRTEIEIDISRNPPNVHFIFVESYGSFFFQHQSLRESSKKLFERFLGELKPNGWKSISNFSESPITGGQSWLTYSSVLYGLRMSDNTLFESYLNDPVFRCSNSLLQVFKNAGYTNYNLNPIKPINGIDVPYGKMREFYSIDNWILNENMPYTGDVYGWGECAPDQYSMNFTMLQVDKTRPYTFFFLTKNSHSPFVSPELVRDWKSLNHQNGQKHIHKGFLKKPSIDNYQKSIAYEFDVISNFINEHGNDNDIFLVMGDHQPPVLSNPDLYGLETPVHVIAKNQFFLDNFIEYGFKGSLDKCDKSIKHEAMYSIFLRSFIKSYCREGQYIPDYEPDGARL